MISHLFIHPVAGRFRRDPNLLPTLLLQAPRGCRVHLCATATELADAAALVSQGPSPTWVAIAGGDGTVSRVLTELVRSGGWDLPPVAILPCGTMNTTARNWSIDPDPLRVLARLGSDAQFQGATSPRRPTLLVEWQESAPSRIAMTVGAGLVSRFFDAYDATPGGTAPAAGLVARTFFQAVLGRPAPILAPMALSLTVDGHPVTGSAYTLVVASTLRDLGLHMQTNYRAGDDPASLHLVASQLPARRLAYRLPRVWRGKAIGDGFDALVSSFQLAFPTVSSVVIDGDRVRTRGATVRVGPSVPVLTS